MGHKAKCSDSLRALYLFLGVGAMCVSKLGPIKNVTPKNVSCWQETEGFYCSPPQIRRTLYPFLSLLAQVPLAHQEALGQIFVSLVMRFWWFLDQPGELGPKSVGLPCLKWFFRKEMVGTRGSLRNYQAET